MKILYFSSALFESLSDVGQSHRESLEGGKRILEVQCVGVLINPAKLHHLQTEDQFFSGNQF